MAEDAEKLRKQIHFLSNLIKSNQEVKQGSKGKESQSTGRYSWSKSRHEKTETTLTQTQCPKHSQIATQTSSKNNTGAISDGSKNIIKLSEKASSSSVGVPKATNIVLMAVKRTENSTAHYSKPNLIGKLMPYKSESKWIKPPIASPRVNQNEEKSHSDSEIYKETRLGNSRTKVDSAHMHSSHSLEQSKTASASMSSLSARLSELSSSLASTSAKLKPVTSKLVVKTTPGYPLEKPVKSTAQKIKQHPTTSLNRELPKASSTALKKSKDKTSLYSWNKSQNYQSMHSVNHKKVVKKSKVTPAKLKWTKPGLSQAHKQTRALSKVVRTHRESPYAEAVPSVSGVGKHVWTARTKPFTGSQSKHVWRSHDMMKLDRSRARSSPSLSSASHPSAARGFIAKRRKALQRNTPKKSVITRYSVIHTKRRTPITAERSNKVVVIGGVAYKSSANKLQKARPDPQSQENKPNVARKGVSRHSSLTVNIRGEKFTMDSSGKTLRRVNKARNKSTAEPSTSRGSTWAGQSSSSSSRAQSIDRRRSSLTKICIGGAVFTETASGVLVRTSQQSTKVSASRKSVYNALQYTYRKNTKAKPKAHQYCMYYNRFGKCNKGEKCPYIHDPSKVAVCTKFLRGTCKKTDGSCPFSHKLDKEKMPVCQFFLRGTCFNDDCPYSHVNVSNKAAVCEDFIKGYCPLGQQCKKKHTLECEEFSLTGKCSKGRACKQMHRTRSKARKRRLSDQYSSEPSAKRAAPVMTEDEGFLPLVQTHDSATQEGSSETQDTTINQQPAQPVEIRPRFLRKKDKEG